MSFYYHQFPVCLSLVGGKDVETCIADVVTRIPRTRWLSLVGLLVDSEPARYSWCGEILVWYDCDRVILSCVLSF